MVEREEGFNKKWIIIGGIILLVIIIGWFLFGNQNNKQGDFEILSECDLSCFEEKFQKCESAITKISKNNPFSVISYEIIEFKENLCEVKMKIFEYPDPKWINSEMICLFNNSFGFSDAVKDLSNCSVELNEVSEELK